jgi:hypothetical protein
VDLQVELILYVRHAHWIELVCLGIELMTFDAQRDSNASTSHHFHDHPFLLLGAKGVSGGQEIRFYEASALALPCNLVLRRNHGERLLVDSSWVDLVAASAGRLNTLLSSLHTCAACNQERDTR